MGVFSEESHPESTSTFINTLGIGKARSAPSPV
jgi:hypothetical protein